MTYLFLKNLDLFYYYSNYNCIRIRRMVGIPLFLEVSTGTEKNLRGILEQVPIS